MESGKLRTATEDDVTAALDGSYVGDALDGIAPVVLLEFFNDMLDVLTGARRDEE